ncbi:MAG: polysaccharide deacetylase family protein [Candidatus Dormibacteria bacterium]
MGYSGNVVVIARPTRRVQPAGVLNASTRDLINQASVLLVIAFSVATILFSGLRLGQHYGVIGRIGNAVATSVRPAFAAALHATRPPASSSSDSTPSDIAAPAALPRVSGAPQRPSGILRGGRWIPVLMYHYIRVAPAGDKYGYNLSVTPTDFARQMRWLRDNGYNAVTMRQVDLAFISRQPLPAKPLVLTFDDGYRDFYTTAAPILRELGLTAVDYVATGLVDRPGYMTWAQVRELDGQGFEMADHTETHADLSRQPTGRDQIEIYGSKSDLENHLGHPVVDFAYPYGGYNFNVMKMLHDAGFWSATTTEYGGFHDADHMFDFSRIRVSGGEALEGFIHSVVAPTSSPAAPVVKTTQ